MNFGDWCREHARDWWWLYALVAVAVLIVLVALTLAEREDNRVHALANPQLRANNHELVATIGDCEVYQLVSQRHVKVTICATSHATMAAY